MNKKKEKFAMSAILIIALMLFSYGIGLMQAVSIEHEAQKEVLECKKDVQSVINITSVICNNNTTQSSQKVTDDL